MPDEDLFRMGKCEVNMMKYRFAYKEISGCEFLVIEWYDKFTDRWEQQASWVVDSSRKAYEEFTDYIGNLIDNSECGSIELA